MAVDLDDIQGLVRHAYSRLTEACFYVLRIADAQAARRWLSSAPVTSAALAAKSVQEVLQVALTSDGLRALGVPQRMIEQFSSEFNGGMSADANRSRRLGDVDTNAPENWKWGGSAAPHMVVLLYAAPGRLAEWTQAVTGPEWATAFSVEVVLPTTDMKGLEPFGFADGISQPALDWQLSLPSHDRTQPDYSNLIELGEFLLGYANAYGRFTERPLVEPADDPQGLLAPAEDAPDKRDLGRNGSYLVLRQLRQDVQGFWRFHNARANGDPAARKATAEAMVGRTMAGVSLLEGAQAPSPDPGTKAGREQLNAFTYAGDADGLRCPFGAHVRRANPRNGDLPDASGKGLLARLLTTLGFDAAALRGDLVASSRFHRMLRRGREYGQSLPPEAAIEDQGDGVETGLHFICLGANISRQFEFIQGAWITGAKFNGLAAERDPLIGERQPLSDGSETDRFSLPQAEGAACQTTGLPQFVTVMGGAYFFMPSLRALRFLVTLDHSNTSSPVGST
ncbi:Multifunctional dye peroxidase DyP2 [Paraburkholderia caffeinitolerans]|uniref:Multifunctional dye peroxidase DyP2 n=1 Tax=Paraburkholderia caffeinitolerans TaxID=1723730 RepID=A0A6J5H5A2_9BURK|nr:peroxidase [Paraburkholderia caffeinitolerans]CAB3809199.1 Multifunctional dye peroxidase DyP2 [Paraburkholderia caffeinitolerans]